jgi:acetyltransferase-like isoleucine patch superfamily enzyme
VRDSIILGSILTPQYDAVEVVEQGSKISIGKFTYGYEHLKIRLWGEGTSLRIGNFCSLSDNITFFLGGNHRTDWMSTYPFGHIFTEKLGNEDIVGHPASKGNIVVGNDVWIGSGVTIMSGVTIGDGAAITANSTITKDVQPYELIGGNPAKSIRYRFSPEIINLLLELSWWNLPIESIKSIAKTLSTVPSSEKLEWLIKRYRT